MNMYQPEGLSPYAPYPHQLPPPPPHPPQRSPYHPAVVHQPQMMSQTKVVVGDVRGGMPCQIRPWTTGLCGCLDDVSSCCLVTLFPTCYLCWLSGKMGEGCCMPWCVPGALFALRVKLRSENLIQGSIMTDFWTTVCCGACALCQLKRELDIVIRNEELARR